jgi:hypothetical protein
MAMGVTVYRVRSEYMGGECLVSVCQVIDQSFSSDATNLCNRRRCYKTQPYIERGKINTKAYTTMVSFLYMSQSLVKYSFANLSFSVVEKHPVFSYHSNYVLYMLLCRRISWILLLLLIFWLFFVYLLKSTILSQIRLTKNKTKIFMRDYVQTKMISRAWHEK